MNKYKNITYSFNVSKKKLFFYIAFGTTAILVLLHTLGYITWQSQEFTDEQTTPFVWLLLLVTAILAWRAKSHFVGILLLQEKLVFVDTKTTLFQFFQEKSYQEYNFTDIEKIVIGGTAYTDDESDMSKLSREQILSFLDNQANIAIPEGEFICMYIKGKNNNLSSFCFGSTAKEKTQEVIARLKERGIAVDVHAKGL